MLAGMDDADHLNQSIGLAVTAVRGTDAARYGDPTPCTEYSVGDVVNHIAFGLLLAHRSGARQEWDPAWTAEDRAPFLVGRPQAEWAQACAEQATATERAWADPAAWEGESHLGGAPMPAAAIGSLMTAEFAVHAWDLAVATGQDLDVPAGLGEVVLEGVTGMAPMGREGGWFGDPVSVPEDASAFERALAASGRDPGWTARGE
jgi:uncharacterized protein (TIGR03086 family)